MMKKVVNTLQAFWIILVITQVSQTAHSTYYSRLSHYDLMKCTYGERGSLTATCVNATPSFFKSTPYKFDHLDETLKCLNCTLKTIESGTFDISGNQIKHLEIHNCQIEDIKPRAFVGLIFLETLDLSNNHIQQIIPGAFAAVKKITTVDLSFNLITSLVENGFAELVNLQNLILRNNEIKSIAPKSFNGLSNLIYLDLSMNSISEVSTGVFDNLTHLVKLNLTQNNIHTLKGNEFQNLSSLLLLDLTSNHISVPLIEISSENRLKKLVLSKNNIESMAPDSLISLRNLQYLDLSFNQIRDILIKSFEDMFNLDTLDLSYNKLTELKTNWFTGLPQLEYLNCSHNNIKAVELVGVFLLNNLYVLDLSYNKLSDLDYAGLINRLPKLSYLRLEENSLPCDLENEMDKYFAEDNFKFVLYKENSDIPPKCNDKPLVKQNYDSLSDYYVQQPAQIVTSGEIWIFMFLSIAVILLAVLFYMQYSSYVNLKNRSVVLDMPNTQLIPSNDNEPTELR